MMKFVTEVLKYPQGDPDGEELLRQFCADGWEIARQDIRYRPKTNRIWIRLILKRAIKLPTR